MSEGAVPDLQPHHLAMLRDGSGIPTEVIRERGYRSIADKRQLATLGFAPRQCRVPGLLLPVCAPDGTNGLHAFRPDLPRQDAAGKELKYELPKGCLVRLDVPPRCRPALKDPAVDLWITEGQKKGDALAARGFAVVVLLGVWNFKGRNELGGVTLLADFDLVAWNGRTVNVVFDSDLMHKQEVRQALARLTEILQRKGAVVNQVFLPDAPDGAKQGVDDYLLSHTPDELRALVGAPRPRATAAPPHVELLDGAPPRLTRPLALIERQSYAASWLYVRTTVRESLVKGEVVRHDPPQVATERALHVVRGDGRVFGPADMPLDGLGLDVALPESPREERLWRKAGVARYRLGERPDPADLFGRLVAVYDHFIDFDRGFGDQRAMCELSACFSLVTWLAPAFAVLGYPWPSGERGSGKTQWGTCWARTSYLGEVVLSSGSFAALRDLADQGASLLFDDAESLSDPRKCDPTKRELLLAGNRKGAGVPIKEAAPDGRTWRTRWLDTFAPRGFTAIALPDPVLASRSVLIPLARTGDSARGNRDPADTDRWPCDQRQLQDDLWALALWLLPAAAGTWAELDAETGAVGREFEPWRALVAVARLMGRHGVDGLEDRVRQLMRAYRKEKADLLDFDRTVLVVQALLALVSDMCDMCDMSAGDVALTSTQVCEAVKAAAAADERDAEWATSQRMGKILARLRLRKATRSGKARGWLLGRAEALALGRAYGLDPDPDDDGAGQGGVPPAETSPHVTHVTGEPAPCFSCGSTERWGDPPLCGVCHPRPY